MREARAGHKELAVQMAQFHEFRGRPRQPFQTASLTPSLPQLLSPPRLVERPMALGTRATEQERAQLAALSADPAPRLLAAPAPASRGPQHYREPNVVPAPAYDEEHPEELSYRPFPIAPFLTATASADDPALAGLVHPDLPRILEMMDQENTAPPMRLRPGIQAAQLMWAQQFKGEAVNFSSLLDSGSPPAGPQLPNRKVATQPQ